MRLVIAGATRLAVATAAALALSTSSAFAVDYVVNSTADPGDGTCDGTECTLREAIAATGSNDNVVFDFTSLGGSAPFTIQLSSGLTVAASEITIDGLDCTGCGTVAANTNAVSSGFNSSLAVRITPGGTYSGGPLLTIEGNQVEVIGLNFDGAPASAVRVDGDDALLQDLYVGTSITGSPGTGNAGNGIETLVALDLTVDSCLVAGNAGNGIIVSDEDSDSPTIITSIIGTERTGTTALPNNGHGIYILGSGDEIIRPTIGGTTAAEGNLISGNAGDGIRIQDKVTGENENGTQTYGLIGNNIVGTNGAADAAIPNGTTAANAGLAIVGGTGSSVEPEKIWVVDNIFSGNIGSGVYLESCKKELFHGNLIGTDGAGTSGIPNTGDGMWLAGSNVVGGKDTKQHIIGGSGVENTIAFNGGDGIRMQATTNGVVKENDVLANVIHSNTGIGIDNESGNDSGPLTPAANTCANSDAWGNRQVGKPVINNAILVSGTLVIDGNACGNADVDIYLADGDALGYGEPMTFLGSTSAGGGAGAWSASLNVSGIVNPGDFITALQHDNADAETSEAALNVQLFIDCDSDGDGFDLNNGTSCTGTDCDDGDATTYPGATELCDGVDNACAGSLPADEADADGDLELACEGDCDDTDASVNTEATEVCNAIDDDCDTSIDEDFDGDSDGVTTCGPDGIAGNTDDDCDDANADANPGEPEVCDAVDNDCDGTVDDGFDADSDGVTTCGPDGIASNTDDDCDDAVATTFPGATELCDGVDNDCDGSIDEQVDGDGDGITECAGDCDDTDATVFPGATEACDGVDTDCDGSLGATETDADADGELVCQGDCDDTNAAVNTDAAEICNAIDDDCDGSTDEGFDGDSDGVTSCGPDGVAGNTDDDCDDTNALILPGAGELCDAIDQDCDGTIDEGFDGDSDGVTTCGPDGIAGNTDDDCDDTDATANPGATEVCDGVDNDCDGSIDEQVDGDGDGITVCDGDCDDTNATVFPGATEACDGLDTDCDGTTPADEADDDADGEMICQGDCDDTAAAVNTGATEVCNAIDDDCDTDVDEGFDADGDGVTTCGADGVGSTADDDCDDTNALVLPGAGELCDAIDQDCDGSIDEGFDGDSDGVTTCGPDGIAGNTDDDCDDTNAAVSPTATEICDGIDNDCDGTVDEQVDGDGDGFTGCAGDCDDNNATVYPGATELCDGLDTDCDGTLPTDESDADSDGESTCAGDCDDGDAGVNTSASETCDAVDEDCDGTVDNGFDGDGDGVTTCGADGLAGTADDDCDDNEAAALPGGTEVCDAIDNDCDGTADDGFDGDSDGVTTCGPDGIFGNADDDCDDTNASVSPTEIEVCDGIDNDCDLVIDEEDDADGDGYTGCDGDCDDNDASVNPGAAEVCDGVDTDCDGTVPADEADADADGEMPCDGDCDDTQASVNTTASEVCDGVDTDCDGTVPADEADADADGEMPCEGDCDDTEPTAYSTATELCDGIDNDCDGDVDEQEDLDQDGFTSCDGDCDDDDDTAYPGADELCDAVDNDCDGDVDEGFDADEDGVTTCGDDGVDGTEDDDCDDDDAAVSPEQTEVCDGVDNDCDSDIDEEADIDGDGFTNCDGDCDDEDDTVYPEADELCDGLDNDCDGLVPDDETDDDGDGQSECADGDCDDADAAVFVGAEEVCEDAIDQDCDGEDAPCEEIVPGDVDVTLGALADCDGCAVGAESPTPAAALMLLLVAALRRRRR